MTLLEEARELIKRYLAEHPNLSIACLSRDAGIPASTARSIIQGEVKKTSKENLTSLLEVFMPAKDVQSLLQRHGHEKRSSIVDVYADNDAKTIEPKDFEWESPDHEIVALASSQSGIKRERILQLYGTEHGEKRLDALLNAGILREINGAIKQHSEFMRYPADHSHSKAKLQAQGWKAEHTENGGFSYHMTQSCNEVGVEKSREYAREYLAKMSMLQKEHPGGNRVIMLSIFANMLDEGETK